LLSEIEQNQQQYGSFLERGKVTGMTPFLLTDVLREELLRAARAARSRAYAPYSSYRVGAAVLDEAGRIHAGCNVENAAYPQGVCAEAAALCAMVLAGGSRVRAVLVTGAAADASWTTPCGGCRQKLREFCAPDTPILTASDDAIGPAFTLAQLLPESFGPEHLNMP
jgi:cytidine deaminase